MKRVRLKMRQKRALQGYLYILPWLIGLGLFFVAALAQTTAYAFSQMNKSTFALTFVGWDNFTSAFTKDAEFPPMLVDYLLGMKDVLLILIFAFFVALLLRRKFPGSAAVKAVFFLTIVMSSDLMTQVQSSQTLNAQMGAAIEESQQTFTLLESMDLSKFFVSLGINNGLFDYLGDEISNIFGIMVRSGVQIFIFMAALHAIPESMYEASSMEGASAWETFWKITFPLCGPMLLVNFVYSVVDTYGSTGNAIIQYIYRIGYSNFNFGYSSALSWIYFLCVSFVLGLVFLLLGKRVFYYN